MKKRDIIIFASVGLIVLVIAFVVVWPRGSVVQPTISASSSRLPGVFPGASSSSPVTVTSLATGIHAPGVGSTTASADVAVPVVQVPVVPGGSASYRSFTIKIDNDAYSPNTIIVNQGDTVNLEIIAVDGNYAFTQPNYGFNATIKEGSTQRIQFQALQAGKFTFYCGSCGGPSKGPVGYLEVVSQ